MASLEEIREERLKKINKLREEGVKVYPVESNYTHTLLEASEDFESLSESKEVLTLAGRVVAKRGQGAVSFLDLKDGTGKLQALFHREKIAEKNWTQFQESLDVGDFIEVKGFLFKTKSEEKTLEVSEWRMLAKSLRPLPDKWHGLKDTEERFRRRYLNSLMDDEVKNRFILRSRLIAGFRNMLDKAGYLEVETPILQNLPGGASALPFVTHHNALDIDLYLRISPELYLKKMLVGGFDRVYEFARDFRNEGIDVTHNPEFTVLEYYEAYSDATKQMAFVEKLFKGILKALDLKSVITYGEHQINFKPKFKVVTYFDLLKKHALINDPGKIEVKELALKASQLGIKPEFNEAKEVLFDLIYKKVCRPKLVEPTFVTDYPKDYLPLAKAKPENPKLVDAFQLIVGGVELVKAFSELNDPLDQRERFMAQEKQKAEGNIEAQPKDEDFLEALEYGMPPAGGVGIGIDRLVMLLTNTHNIREVIYFPTLRPR